MGTDIKDRFGDDTLCVSRSLRWVSNIIMFKIKLHYYTITIPGNNKKIRVQCISQCIYSLLDKIHASSDTHIREQEIEK